ncbi:MAG: KEOPS complex N(6)-L-threonylcarbamoyladenine synthase Kae1 [Candidatus Bathyarchaeia archaeon]
MSRKYCLGIESTAHTFGASVVTSEGIILSDEKSVYRPERGGGIHPRECSQYHASHAAEVISRAIEVSGIRFRHLSAIAFSQGPGLGPCLRNGATIARALSLSLSLPLIPVNHAMAHIEIGSLSTRTKDPLVLLVSGGHTCIAGFAGDYWRVIGETQDITLGNLLDMFGREMGFPSPGGPEVERLAQRGANYIDLPYVIKGNDVSYSGLFTALLNRANQKSNRCEDICFSLQETAFSTITEATERALAFTGKKELLLTGGVAANRRLQTMLRHIAKKHNTKFAVVPQNLAADGGAQIAWTGYLAFSHGVTLDIANSQVKPQWRFDQIQVPWR